MFPSLSDLETVENYVFGMRPPSVPELSSLAAGDLMAIAVFATEYRTAVDTVHRKHADVCYARCGVARVGTEEPLYDEQARGFQSSFKGKVHAFRVLPTRYCAYIAVQRSGKETSFGPMRFNYRKKHPNVFGDPGGPDEGDQKRLFWVPLHKLFDGDECLRDHPGLKVELIAHHVNEKIRRIHLELDKRKIKTGWSRPDIDNPPFRFTEEIAEFSDNKELGKGMLVPVAHTAMVEKAEYKGKPLTFTVPAADGSKVGSGFSPTLNIIADDRFIPRPNMFTCGPRRSSTRRISIG